MVKFLNNELYLSNFMETPTEKTLRLLLSYPKRKWKQKK